MEDRGLKKSSRPTYPIILEGNVYGPGIRFIEAEPNQVQELVEELAGMKLASSVIKQVYAVTGHYDLIPVIESPDVPSLDD